MTLTMPNMQEEEDAEENIPHQRLYCYKDNSRVCGPDCMAYLTNPPTDRDYINQAWSRCLLLVSSHRTGKHLTIIAASLGKVGSPPGTPLPAPPVVR